MAKLLFSVVAPLAVAVNPTAISASVPTNFATATSPVTQPVAVQTQPTTSHILTAPLAGSTQLASTIGFVPTHEIVFDKYVNVVKQIFDDAIINNPGPSGIIIEQFWAALQPKLQQTTIDYQRVLKNMPFTDAVSMLAEVTTNSLNSLVTEINNWSSIPVGGSTPKWDVNLKTDQFRDTIQSDFDGYAIQQNDTYIKAVDDQGLAEFVKSLVDGKIPFKNGMTDYTTIINTVANKILNDEADLLPDKVEISVFQDAINKKFVNSDAFISEIVTKIVRDYIDYDNVSKAIEQEIVKEYNSNQTKLDNFGLSKLSSDYKMFFEQNVKINLGGATTKLGATVTTLLNNLNALSSQTPQDAKTVIDDWTNNTRAVFIKDQNKLLDDRLKINISKVQADWKTVLDKLPDVSSFWDAYSVQKRFNESQKKSGDSFLAFWTLLGQNTTELTKFLKDYSSDTLTYDPSKPDAADSIAVAPAFFNAQLSIAHKDAEAAGQKTWFNYDFQLSKSIIDAENNPAEKFIPNFDTDQNVRAIYTYAHDKYVTVDGVDLKKIILSDFTINSNPTSEDNKWKVAQPYSSLDLQMAWKGKIEVPKLDANGTTILTKEPIDQNYFNTPILMLDTTEDVAKLFPRLNWLISDPTSEFSYTLQDALFGASAPEKANIYIDETNKPTVSTVNPSTQNRFQNYDLSLSIKVGQTVTDFNGASEKIQANNVEVYNQTMDDEVSTALKGYLEQILSNNKDESYVAFVVGEFWKWQNITDNKDKVPMTREFNHLYELLNLLFSNDDKAAGIPSAKLTKDELQLSPEEQETAMRQHEIAQLNAISSLDYSNVQPNNPHRLKLLLNNYPPAIIFNRLNISGSITVSKNANNGWEVHVDLMSQGARFKSPNDGNYPATATSPAPSYAKESFSKTNFQMSIHSLTEAIEKAIKEVTETIDPYKPLFDKMVGRGDIEQTALNDFIGGTIKTIVDKFSADVSQMEIASEIEDHANLAKDTIKEEIVKWLSQSSKNASSQLNDWKNKIDSAQKLLEQNPNYNPTDPDIQARITEYKVLKTSDILAGLVGTQLPDSIKQSLEDARQKISAMGLQKELDNLIELESKVAIISTPKQGTIALATGYAANAALKNNNPYDSANITEEGDLVIEQIAEYLATSDLSDISDFKTLKDLLENPLAMQKIQLSVPMKAAIIALGSLIGIVGIGTTFSTLRSIKTSKNLQSIGEEASIEYEKPWKIMIIKGLISFASVAAAAAIITLVFTLGGGI